MCMKRISGYSNKKIKTVVEFFILNLILSVLPTLYTFIELNLAELMFN